MKRNTIAIWLIGTLAALTAAVPARADLFRDIGLGLSYAGFNVEGRRNPLSQGADVLINNNFIGESFNFGIGELRMQGPVSLQVSAGRRWVDTLDVSLSTALSRDLTPAPLAYSLTADVGGQEMAVTGSVLIDADLSVNGFGFYELNVDYSSRQTVDREGRFSNSSDNYDFDFGPIVVEGNIYADILAVLTAPFFEVTGIFNPFLSFSGREQLKQAMDASLAEMRAHLAAGAQVDALVLPATIVGPLPLGQSAVTAGALAAQGGAVVPEPAVVVLMLLGIPLLLVRRFRRARVAR